MNAGEWILLHNTASRVSYVRRIEYDPRWCVFTVTFCDGITMQLPIDGIGGDWCLKVMEAGKNTAAAAKAIFDDEDHS